MMSTPVCFLLAVGVVVCLVHPTPVVSQCTTRHCQDGDNDNDVNALTAMVHLLQDTVDRQQVQLATLRDTVEEQQKQLTRQDETLARQNETLARQDESMYFSCATIHTIPQLCWIQSIL